jgi:hypothetical protein
MECPSQCGQFKAALDRIGSRHRFSVSKKEQAQTQLQTKQSPLQRKKSRAQALLKNCVDPISPKNWI